MISPRVGCRPLYVQPVTDARWGIAHGVRCSDVEIALRDARSRGSPVGAVLVVSPTYHGYVSNVAGAGTAACGSPHRSLDSCCGAKARH